MRKLGRPLRVISGLSQAYQVWLPQCAAATPPSPPPSLMNIPDAKLGTCVEPRLRGAKRTVWHDRRKTTPIGAAREPFHLKILGSRRCHKHGSCRAQHPEILADDADYMVPVIARSTSAGRHTRNRDSAVRQVAGLARLFRVAASDTRQAVRCPDARAVFIALEPRQPVRQITNPVGI